MIDIIMTKYIWRKIAWMYQKYSIYHLLAIHRNSWIFIQSDLKGLGKGYLTQNINAFRHVEMWQVVIVANSWSHIVTLPIFLSLFRKNSTFQLLFMSEYHKIYIWMCIYFEFTLGICNLNSYIWLLFTQKLKYLHLFWSTDSRTALENILEIEFYLNPSILLTYK